MKDISTFEHLIGLLSLVKIMHIHFMYILCIMPSETNFTFKHIIISNEILPPFIYYTYVVKHN